MRILYTAIRVAAALTVAVLEPGLFARTLVFPHFVETAGTVNNTQYTFDTILFATWVPASPADPGSTATLDLFLYDNSGAALMNNGVAVCEPCSYPLGSAQPKQTIVIDDLIMAKGGFFDAVVKIGYMVVEVTGDETAVNVDTILVNAHTSTFDVANAPMKGAVPDASPTRVLPHFVESSGSTTTTAYSFDTTIYLVYPAGQGGIGAGRGAAADLYLFAATGLPLMNNGIGVCNPCSYPLGTSNRKQTIRIDDLIKAKGGSFDAGVKIGYAVLNLSGDIQNVYATSMVVNAHTSPFDVTVYESELEDRGEPRPHVHGDADGDAAVTSTDLFFLINYLFAGGPPPL